MKTTEFNKIYEQAKHTNVVTDYIFNCAGWFWINLTEKQLDKMYKLMLSQGAKEISNAAGIKRIELKSGLGIIKSDKY